jgi:hypothetical protein
VPNISSPSTVTSGSIPSTHRSRSAHAGRTGVASLTLSAHRHPDAHAGVCLLVAQQGPEVARELRHRAAAQGQVRVESTRLAARALGRVACNHSQPCVGASRHRLYHLGLLDSRLLFLGSPVVSRSQYNIGMGATTNAINRGVKMLFGINYQMITGNPRSRQYLLR